MTRGHNAAGNAADEPRERAGRDRALVLLYTGAFLVWVLLRPAPPAVVRGVSSLAAVLGPLLALPLFVGRPAVRIHRWRVRQQWVAPLLGLAQLSYLGAMLLTALWEMGLYAPHTPAPGPPLAALPIPVAGVLWLGAILLLPLRPIPAVGRARVVLDGLILIGALATIGWYYLLGPTLLQAQVSPATRAGALIVPLYDLVLLVVLLQLTRATPRLRPAARPLGAGFALIAAGSVLFQYILLHQASQLTPVRDVVTATGLLLLAMGAGRLRALLARPAGGGAASNTLETGTAGATDLPPWWRVLLPYAPLPLVGVVLASAHATRGLPGVTAGVDGGALLLVGLIVARQLLALAENRHLYRQVQAQNRALQALATTDPLTDRPNHRALVAALDHELERAHRYGRPCALLFLDLDHFKALNDTYGHAVGDAALRAAAVVAQGALRGVDILGRWGGEEFVALLPEIDAAGALVTAERVRAAVAAHPVPSGGGTHLTCSVGVAAYPHDAETRDALVAAADRAMYAAKQMGRNQVRAAADPAVAACAGDGMADGSREEAALTGMVEALVRVVETRDQRTGEHADEVGALTVRLAVALGMGATEARTVGLAARVHDVGKVAVPDAILRKPGQLTEEEWAVLRRHAAVGADIVGQVPALRTLAPLVRAHHERWDGCGYPDGLTGEAIPRGARLIAVADAYSAMTMDRPYRAARSRTAAVTELQRCGGTQFDPAVVEALAAVLGSEGTDLSAAAAAAATAS